MKKIRTLKAEEIEVRVQSVKNGKANMLLYINSRAATDLLDETYGMENWTIEYKEVAGQIYGKLSIWDNDNSRWIFREDTGSESNVEANKGLASDIVKRCIVRFGVTELYSSPKIQIDDDGYGNTGYKVTEITYDDRRNITHLVIANRFGKETFRWDANEAPKKTFKMNNETPVETKPELEYREKYQSDKENREKELVQWCSQLKEEFPDRYLQIGEFYKKKKAKIMDIKIWKYEMIRKFFIGDYCKDMAS